MDANATTCMVSDKRALSMYNIYLRDVCILNAMYVCVCERDRN